MALTTLRGLSLAALVAAAAGDSTLLRGGSVKATTWPVKAKCQSWCEPNFKNKDPVKVCAYMEKNGVACTEWAEPCVANSGAKPAGKCQAWCANSFKKDGPAKVCGYARCAGCDPCVESGPATGPATKAEQL